MSPSTHQPELGLSAISTVPLPPERQAYLDSLAGASPLAAPGTPTPTPTPTPPGQGQVAGGAHSPIYRARVRAELRDLFGLEAIAPRLTILAVDARAELKALVRLVVPVAVVPPGADEAVIEPAADLALAWPVELLARPLSGFSMVEVVGPQHVMHPNVSRTSVDGGGEDAGSAAHPQMLCLGAQVPRGMPLTEAVLASYAALSMQAITLDERDVAGVMSLEGARFWQARVDRIPLTDEPFLAGGAP